MRPLWCSGRFEVRDSKLADAPGIIGMSAASFASLVADLKAGRLTA